MSDPTRDRIGTVSDPHLGSDRIGVGSAPLYPVTLDLQGRPCLVVGGGPVAARKVRGLLHCRAEVTVVAPEICPQIVEAASSVSGGLPSAGSLELQRRCYRSGEAAEYRLVFAATSDRDLNRLIYEEAEAAGVFVNAADDPASCSFMLPAIVRHDPVTVAVSTGGSSPALAVWLRDVVAATVTAEDAGLAELLGEARRAIHLAGRSSEEVDWRGLLDGKLRELVREGRIEEARSLISEWTRRPEVAAAVCGLQGVPVI